MSESLNNNITRNLTQNLNFEIVFSAFPGMEYHCSSVSFPGMNLSGPKIPNQMLAVPLQGDHIEFDDLSVTFNIDEEFKNYFELYDRFVKCAPINDSSTHVNLTDGTVMGDVKLIILSNNKNPIKVIDFIGLIPRTLSGFELSAQTPEPEPIPATATFSYLKFEENTEAL